MFSFNQQQNAHNGEDPMDLDLSPRHNTGNGSAWSTSWGGQTQAQQNPPFGQSNSSFQSQQSGSSFTNNNPFSTPNSGFGGFGQQQPQQAAFGMGNCGNINNSQPLFGNSSNNCSNNVFGSTPNTQNSTPFGCHNTQSQNQNLFGNNNANNNSNKGGDSLFIGFGNGDGGCGNKENQVPKSSKSCASRRVGARTTTTTTTTSTTSGVCAFGNPATPAGKTNDNNSLNPPSLSPILSIPQPNSNPTTSTTTTTSSSSSSSSSTGCNIINANRTTASQPINENDLLEFGQIVEQCAHYFAHTGVSHWKERSEAAEVLKKYLVKIVQQKTTLPPVVSKRFVEMAPLFANQLKDGRPQLLQAMLQCMAAMVQACGEEFAEVAYNLIPTILLCLKKTQKIVVAQTTELIHIILMYCPHYSYVEHLVLGTKSTHPGTRIACIEYIQFLIEGWADTATPDEIKWSIMQAVEIMVTDASTPKAREAGRICLQAAGKAWPAHANAVLERISKTNPSVFKQLTKC